MTDWLDRVGEIAAGGGRDFVVGKGVENFIGYFGKDDSDFSPPEYGSYIATSNAVYTCSNLRADLLSSLPLRVYKRQRVGDDVKGIEQINHPLQDLLSRVNPFWTFNRLIHMTELTLGLWGEAFWFLERGKSGRGPVKEIWWARPDYVNIVPDSKDYIKGFFFDRKQGEEPIFFTPQETVWMRYPNPLDEYAGLAPLAAARLAADIASAAMQSNKRFFSQGALVGGVISPPKDRVLTPEQARSMEQRIERRYSGSDRQHRWMVMLEDFDVKTLSASFKDSEYIATLKWTLEEVARAYKIPPDLIGGESTYSNQHDAERAVWQRAIRPEANFLKAEINEQLAPLFGGPELYVDFDYSEVEVLQEATSDQWARQQGQLQEGVLTINEVREMFGLEAVEWGDTFWKPMAEVDVLGELGGISQPPADDDEERGKRQDRILRGHDPIEIQSDQHLYYARRHDRRTAQYVRKVSDAVQELLRNQQEAVLQGLKRSFDGKTTRQGTPDNPFSLAEWIKTFREKLRPIIYWIVADSASAGIEDIGLAIDFNTADPRFLRYIETRAQRFATKVNETTWKQLQESLSQGMAAGEGIPALSERVEKVMGDRIRSTPEAIARTEVNGASNGGTLQGWQQSGVVQRKAWLASLDERVRDSHADAHMRYQENPIPLEEDFILAQGSGPAPGNIDSAAEVVNCRCSMIAVLDERAYRDLTGRSPIEAINLPAVLRDQSLPADQLDQILSKLKAVRR